VDKVKEEIKNSGVIVNFIGGISGDEKSLRTANVEGQKRLQP